MDKIFKFGNANWLQCQFWAAERKWGGRGPYICNANLPNVPALTQRRALTMRRFLLKWGMGSEVFWEVSKATQHTRPRKTKELTILKNDKKVDKS